MTEGSKIPTVRVLPSQITFAVEPGTTVFEAAVKNGIWWPTICHGSVECASCHMEVIEGEERISPMEEKEQEVLDRVLGRDEPQRQERLACCAQITGDIIVRRRSVRVRKDPNGSGEE